MLSTVLRICQGIQKLILKPELNAMVTTTRGRTLRHAPKKRYPHWFTKQHRVLHKEYLTHENEEFIQEAIEKKYVKQTLTTATSTHISPLKEAPIEPQTIEWKEEYKRTGLLARKIGIYPMWLKNGKKISTTLLQVVDNHVIKYIPPEKHQPRIVRRPIIKRKLGCLLVGAESTDPRMFTKEYCGLFNDSGVMPKKLLVRFLITPEGALQPGTPLYATHYKPGDYVDVRSKTIDRGFQGVMKRWGFKGMPATHGVTKTHRRPGNIGSGRERGVIPGTKLPGHMGNRFRILRGLKILRINTKYNIIWVIGQNIPGETNSFVQIYDTILPLRKPTTPPHFPTYFPKDEDSLPEELFAEDLHVFNEPTIMFEEESK